MGKIYTKKGDDGKTGLLCGQRVPKDDIRLEAIGTLDELNASLGMVLSEKIPSPLQTQLHRIQSEIIKVNAGLACMTQDSCPVCPPSRTKFQQLDEEQIFQLEQEIDEVEKVLPPLDHFILPGGNRVSSLLQMSRAICRRAERNISRLSNDYGCPPVILTYINRLSDWLFVMARQTH